jgi:YVTN family beta-propeller protein
MLSRLALLTTLFTLLIACSDGGDSSPGAVSSLGVAAPAGDPVGHPMFMSPHVNPIVSLGKHIYATNTPADTVDVIDAETREVVLRIKVGIDPVALAIRPDEKEIWVANHISDSVSVIDTDPQSPTLHHIIATVQAFGPSGLVTDFDEPTGIAFANNDKAYVALGPDNEIAVVDVASYSVSNRLPINAQDPRAMQVAGDRLFVMPFESHNQSQISGCTPEKIDGDLCTFDILTHVVFSNNILSLGYDADIIINPGLPDRDLYVFDTGSDELIEIVDGIGTLLYGLTVDSQGQVYVAQTDARNAVNGRAGTQKHGLEELENRAFLNQITHIDCSEDCGEPTRFELEPLPPQHPAQGEALATPFAVAMSPDESFVLATAASSNRVFSMDPASGEVLSRVEVGAVPRGIAMRESDAGASSEAWVLNVVDNTVDIIDISDPASLVHVASIALEDPTTAIVKEGRKVFHDANASSTGTFSCESCHPDGHTDQLLWVLDTPICDVEGCTQIPPRSTMPTRGLRDTQPYHWDGIPGDPYGGINTSSINAPEDPNCVEGDEASCTRNLVDGGMASTMCLQGQCPHNDEGLAGAIDREGRDALSEFLLNIPYPPSQRRPINNELEQLARDGIFEFNFVRANTIGGRATGAGACGECHKQPYLVSTNTPGTGMDAPTWRGAYDRYLVLPQGRAFTLDAGNLFGAIDTGFPEKLIWQTIGATDGIWEMVLQSSTGFHGAFSRQVTLNQQNVNEAHTLQILDVLEVAAAEEAIELQGEGVEIVDGEPSGLGIDYIDGQYQVRDAGERSLSRASLLAAVEAGDIVVTLTGRMGVNAMADTPHPGIWEDAGIPMHVQAENVTLTFLSDENRLRLHARHLQDGALIFVDGHRVPGQVGCVSGSLPDCDNELLEVQLAQDLAQGGLHFIQLMSPGGRISNDLMFYSTQGPTETGINLLNTGGNFDDNVFGVNWHTVEFVASFEVSGGELQATIHETSPDVWRGSVNHSAMVVEGQQYSICFDAKAEGDRDIVTYVDSDKPTYNNISEGFYISSLTSVYQSFHYTFTAEASDPRARLSFDMAQSDLDVTLDNIGLYAGAECGAP